MGEQFSERVIRLGIGQAHAGSGRQHQVAQHDRIPQGVQEAFGDIAGQGRLREDDELVTAQPGHQAVNPGGRDQPIPQTQQEGVTHVVPVRVVDLLELIDVDQQQTDRAPRTRLGEGTLEAAPVGQSGQRIVLGQMLAGASAELARNRHTAAMLAPAAGTTHAGRLCAPLSSADQATPKGRRSSGNSPNSAMDG